MTLEQLESLKRRYGGSDGASELASFARSMRARAQERAAKESAGREGKRKDRAEREQGDKLRKQTISALVHEPREKKERTLQQGEKGGTFYVNDNGERVYVK